MLSPFGADAPRDNGHAGFGFRLAAARRDPAPGGKLERAQRRRNAVRRRPGGDRRTIVGPRRYLQARIPIRRDRAADAMLNENQMNQLGYDLLYGAHRPQEAIAVFKLNVEDYPQSFNVYDSLGEAYMVNNEKELAIKNYQKSLELNPNNTSGVEALKRLQAN